MKNFVQVNYTTQMKWTNSWPYALSQFFIYYLFILIFGCTVSSLLSGLFSSCHEWQLFFQLWCMGFSVKWFLLLWNVGSKAYGLQQLLILGSRTQAQQSPRMGLVKNLPAMLETWVQSLGGEDPPGEGSGNLLQYSCLENPTDRGAWWTTVHEIAESDMT